MRIAESRFTLAVVHPVFVASVWASCTCRKSEKEAAFTHQRKWDDFWHNLNLKIAEFRC